MADRQFTIDSQPLLESQDGNGEGKEELEAIQEESNLGTSGGESNLFTDDSSFERAVSNEPSITSNQARPMEDNIPSNSSPKPREKYSGMSTPDREFCQKLEKDFDRSQLIQQLTAWKDKHVAIRYRDSEHTELGILRSVEQTTTANFSPHIVITQPSKHSEMGERKIILIDGIHEAEQIPYSDEKLDKLFQYHNQEVELKMSTGELHTGTCLGVSTDTDKTYTLRLLTLNQELHHLEVLTLPLSDIVEVQQHDKQAVMKKTLRDYRNKDVEITHLYESGTTTYRGRVDGFCMREDKEHVTIARKGGFSTPHVSVWTLEYVPIKHITKITLIPPQPARARGENESVVECLTHNLDKDLEITWISGGEQKTFLAKMHGFYHHGNNQTDAMFLLGVGEDMTDGDRERLDIPLSQITDINIIKPSPSIEEIKRTLTLNMDEKVHITSITGGEKRTHGGIVNSFRMRQEREEVVLTDKRRNEDPWEIESIPLDRITNVVADGWVSPPPPQEMSTTTSGSDEEPKSPGTKKSKRKGLIKTKDAATQTPAFSPTAPAKVHKRTAEGWVETKTETYADKAKKARQPSEVTFQWTPLGKVTPMPRQKKKMAWIKALETAIQREVDRASSSSEWPDFEQALNMSLRHIGISIDEKVLTNVFHNIDETILDNKDTLDHMWKLIEEISHEDPPLGENPEEVKMKFDQWKDTFEQECEAELDRALRDNHLADYRYAVVQAFRRHGDEIDSNWIRRYKIERDTVVDDPILLRNIWDNVRNALQREANIKLSNRRGKTQWIEQNLKPAIGLETHRAKLTGERVDYRAAILISLAETGRMISSEKLVGLEPMLQDTKFALNDKVLSTIWERACLELDHETLVVQGKARSELDRKGLKMDRRTRWARRLKEVSYAMLKQTTRWGGEFDHQAVIKDAFLDIKWSFEPGSFRQFQSKDRFSLLDRKVQNSIWQHACELRNKRDLSVTYAEFPVEVLRREWHKALIDLLEDEKFKSKYYGAKQDTDYKDIAVRAFAEIAWQVPHNTFRNLQLNSKEDLLEPTTLRHVWFLGCSEMKKPRDFFILGSHDPLMSPNFEQELAPGIRKYTELPITLDDKVDKAQLNFDYQRTVEIHQLSFTDWMERSNITKLINWGPIPLEMDEPEILKRITQLGHRDFFLANWMMDYYTTKLGFEMWYNYIGKDLKIPNDIKTQMAVPPPSPTAGAMERDYKLAGIPPLTDHFQTQRKTACTLQAPPEKPTRQEDAKEAPFSWASEVEKQLPIKKDSQPDDSHYTNEPAIMSRDGKFLNRQERHQFYTEREHEIRTTIQQEAQERASEDLSPEQYKAIVHTMAIKLPPMDRTTWELESIKGNTILDPRVEVPWVEPHYFIPGGMISHIFIPNYIYIPKGVFRKFHIWLEEDTTSYIAFWKHLRNAQREANKLVTPEHLKSNHKTDCRKMLKNQLPRTILTKKLATVQHREAHAEAERIGWKNMTIQDIYDWFIRPIERFFAIDMPQGASLLRAMLYPRSAQRLTNLIARFTGIPRGAIRNPKYVVGQMSRIRMAYEADFTQVRLEDPPMIRIPKVRLEEDPSGSCYVKTTHEGMTQQSPDSEDEENQDPVDRQSLYDEEVATWDNIMADYDKAVSVQMQYGPAQTEWLRDLIKKTRAEAKKLLEKCRQRYLSLIHI